MKKKETQNLKELEERISALEKDLEDQKKPTIISVNKRFSLSSIENWRVGVRLPGGKVRHFNVFGGSPVRVDTIIFWTRVALRDALESDDLPPKGLVGRKIDL